MSQFAAAGPGQGTPSGASRPGWPEAASVVAAVLTGAWTLGTTAVLQAGSWLGGQYLTAQERPVPWWTWPAAGWLNALVVGVPAVLLATVPRPFGAAQTAVRAAGRLWALGALLLAVLATVRAVPVAHNAGYLLLLAVVALAAWLVLRVTYRTAPRGHAEDRPALPHGPAVLPGVATGLASLGPWLWLAALGGGLETLCALAAAAAVGLLAASPLGRPFWRHFTGSRARLILLGGGVAGVFLLLVGAGTGASGIQLGELAVLPPLGFAAAALARGGIRPPFSGTGAQPAIAVMLALAALGPLGFVEPVQTELVINAEGHDVGYWAVVAAACALFAALVAGGVLALRWPPGHGWAALSPAPAGALPHGGRRWGAAITAAAVAAAGLTGYATVGAPGLHGDRLFVVMRAQADLSDLARIADPVARRAEAYRRLVATARASQVGLRRDLDRLHLRYTPYYLVDGIEVDGGPAVRAWLAGRPGVDRVLLSPRLRPVPARGEPPSGDTPAPSGPLWNITMIGADRVWATGDTGQGILIGTSDTGVDAGVPALAGSYRGGDDSWFDPWNGTRSPTDHNGHGTHTLATALGRGGVGVAPGAQWIGCVNLDRNLGNPADYLACLQFMLAPFPHGGDPLGDGDPARGAQVLTNSWACPTQEGCDRGALRPAVDALTAAGVFVVAAAGNSGPRCGSITDPPAPYPDTFTVGAVNASGAVADYSSRGPVPGAAKPDVLAPGSGVVSALPGGGYAAMSGTSMAAPHVAGVVALMWSANPRLIGDVAGTARILRESATGGAADGCGGRAGVVDAYAAVGSATAGTG